MPPPPSPLRPGDVVRIRAERWRVLRRVSYGGAAVIEVSGCDRANRGTHTRFVLPFESVDRIEAARVPRVVRPARWRRHARQVLAEVSPSVHALQAALEADVAILPFQLEPALAVARGLGCRLLIADEVGLGKTVQAGLLIAEAIRRQPDSYALVVVPAGLREQWRHEIERRFHLPAIVLDAAALAQAGSAAPPGANPWAAHPVVIVSIDYVKRPEVMRAVEPLVWDVVVFDEAHALSGRSDRAGAAAVLAQRARTVVMLSATPHAGDDDAFARMCGIGDLQSRFPLLVFRRTRRDAGISIVRRSVWLRVRPTRAELAMHEALLAYARLVWAETGHSGHGARLAMSVLARRATSSAASLARSIERRMHLLDEGDSPTVRQLALPWDGEGIDDEAPSAVLMAPGLRDRAGERRRLEQLLGLAHEAALGESKLAALGRLVRRTREHAIVFTEYRDTLATLARHLSFVETVELHGGLTRAERAAVVRRFTSGGARLLLATDAASEGLNLHQTCRLVVHLELPWTPQRLEQRVGRVERIGQARRVHAVHLVAARTSEERIVARLLQRMARMRAALGGLRAVDKGQDEIARVVIGREAPAEDAPSHRSVLPAGTVVPDLRGAAEEEAERLHRARSLRGTGARVPGRVPSTSLGPGKTAESRALVTSIRRRARETSCYWAFGIEVADADDQLLWERLVALQACRVGRAPLNPDRVRWLLDLQRPGLAEILDRERRRTVADLEKALAAPLALGLVRERALIEAISTRHARLSAGLLQPGLFDRRADRAAAAQAAIRDEALARCAARLRRLTLAGSPSAGSCDLHFAVAIG